MLNRSLVSSWVLLGVSGSLPLSLSPFPSLAGFFLAHCSVLCPTRLLALLDLALSGSLDASLGPFFSSYRAVQWTGKQHNWSFPKSEVTTRGEQSEPASSARPLFYGKWAVVVVVVVVVLVVVGVVYFVVAAVVGAVFVAASVEHDTKLLA